MELAGNLSLGWQVAAAAGLVASDRVGGALGRALPVTPEAVARPEVMNELLSTAAPDGAVPLPRVSAVRLPGVDFESSNCRNFIVELEYAGGRARADLPATAYVKLPPDSLATRVFANALGFWALECTFCRHVAHRVPVRVPRVYAVARRGSRFVLVLEDLRAAPGVRMFVNRDMAAGTTPEMAERALGVFAQLHAGFWGWTPAQREALLPFSLHPFASPRRGAVSRALNAAALGPCRSRAPEVFTRELAALARRAISRWDRMIAAWYGGPLTLAHGDSHLGNLFEIDAPSGPRMGMIDFQAVHWSNGLRDVQYFLINSLAPDVLAKHEDRLIDHYVAEISRRGVALDPEHARQDYRAFSFQTLMTAAVSFGLGGLIERENVVRTVLERSAAAVDRLRFADWLDSL
jgi:hypothetical protein